ncbi:MAG: histidine kinase [Bacteroidales bacterium]|nr:histidine kinase [Bacteroidales bacterium]
MRNILKLLLSPYFIALIIALIIIVLLPPMFNKYKVELIESGIIEKKDGRQFYHDLNNDSLSEKLIVFPNIKEEAALKVIGHNEGIVGQWNFKGKLNDKNDCISFGDYDNNGFSEVYVFSKTEDSIFLNIIEPLNPDGFDLKGKFITTINKRDGKMDYHISNGKVLDLNNDSYGEFVFDIRAGFSLLPRGVFAYNIKLDTIIRTPICASSIGNSSFFDLDNDSYPEVLCNSYTPGNHPISSAIPYSDHSAWLMLFDNKLNFLFEPVEFSGIGSHVSANPVNFEDERYVAVLYDYKGKLNNKSTLYLYNIYGEKIKERKLNKEKKDHDFTIYTLNSNNETKLFLFNSLGDIQMFNENLAIIETYHINNINNCPHYEFDIDNNGDKELIFRSKNGQEIIITRNNFIYPVNIDIPFNREELICSVKLNGDQSPYLSIQLGDDCYLYQYSVNPLYYLKYPFYAGIYLLVLLFIVLIQRIQKAKSEEKFRTEKQLIEMQLKNLRNQLEPHFLFNAINSISNAVVKEDKDKAYNFISKLSDLIRSTMLNAEKISRTLDEELEFTENYLLIQQNRFKNSFEYEFQVQGNLDKSLQIPKMLLQNFVENAVKHGFSNIEYKGKVLLKVERNNSFIEIAIEDNGIGRKNALKQKTFGTKQGLIMIDKMLELYYSISKKRIVYKIIDLKDNNENSLGTRVEIRIPVVF